jgi:hypothetical protein
MPRKRWTAQTEVTASLLKIREKKKWQIALRRYLLERNPCVAYAPFFGLDIESFRKWIEMQFLDGQTWENFGANWQFDHVVPVTYFDFADEAELMLGWNFTNIRVAKAQKSNDGGNRVDLLMAKDYFDSLYKETGYEVCRHLLEKICRIELAEKVSTSSQIEFINQHKDYLSHLEGFSSYEFELLNSGRDIEEVKKEAAFIKKMGG